jgi:hypothetical protein
MIALSVCLGCSSQESRIARFIPSADAAESAITTVLTAWKKGIPAGPVPDTSSPVVHVTDSFRDPGEKLQEFRILGEVPGDTPRCFAVELKFLPERTEKVRFVVVGIDPLWVFRMEDYQLLSHWDHNMAVAPAPKDSDPDAGGVAAESTSR